MRETYVAYQRSVHDGLVKPFPGAGSVLAELRGRGVRLGVVTSKGGRIARRTMEVCGLWGAVDVVVAGDEVGRGKPDPEPVFKALDALDLGGGAAEVLLVGDSPVDLRAGRAAGTLTAAVTWGPHEPSVLHSEKPDYVLDELEDVLRILPER